MSFGEKLKEARECRGLMKSELAKKSGIDASTISHLERDKSKCPNAYTVRELAIALNVSADYLLEIPERSA